MTVCVSAGDDFCQAPWLWIGQEIKNLVITANRKMALPGPLKDGSAPSQSRAKTDEQNMVAGSYEAVAVGFIQGNGNRC